MSTSVQAASSYVFRKYIGSIKTKPRSAQKLILGNYSPSNPAKGFSIQLSSAQTDDDAVATRIVTSGSEKRYELTLYVTNNSNKQVSTEVWQM